ncbi:NAD-dependent epimerase/dehydratase family protein [Aliivibrio fischeri]|uniref:NAD-dependent epimerase/dehydratase family protein n=1 Tax=Aliivibrio fischeri TaxID=668 RepID=UPI000907EB3C|nr:NAD-dependent epimerase/dehydratase family protein [Aliivibrio fischeri]MUK61338.1 NAD-dependent epimerase/dehydratase family protein [Aliivibrio fischeri]MUL19473.1 NAD-dependent epimerase/dehydratase family protein [Aliivibrio fischeri]MUL25029.1 NAD-dependent epimerase/dehydratase family protein [Aliivibrio fischeri]
MILLTGATGFIGHYVSQKKLQIKYAVRDNDTSLTNSFVIKALDSKTNWQGAFNQIDSIIHLAGLAHSHSFTNDDYQSVNVDGTLHLAREAAIAGVKRFVFVSSIGVNGTATQQVPFSVDSEPKPHNAYAQSKYDAEIGLKKIADETGLEVVIVRPTLVYGPAAPGNFGALTRLVNKVPVLPFGLVSNKRDFISVQNLADLLVTCVNHPNAAGHTFLASDGKAVSIKDFSNAIAKGLNKQLIQLPVPVWCMRLAGKLLGKSIMVEQLVGDLEVDSSNAQEVLGWLPPYTMQESMHSLLENNQ